MSFEDRLLSDIRMFFNEEFAINLEDLKKPTYVFVRDFYCRVLMELEVDTENVRRASHLIEGTDSDSVEIIGDINLVAAVNHAFKFLKFGLFDLLSPGDNYKRTVSMMREVMNFMFMADDLTSALDFNGLANLREQVCNMAHTIEANRKSLNMVAHDKVRLEKQKAALEKENNNLDVLAQQLKVELHEAETNAKVATNKLEEHREHMKSTQAELEKLKTSISNLKGEMVDLKSLQSKEEQKMKFEKEKTDLHNKYLEKAEARKKYVTALEAIKKQSTWTAEMEEILNKFGEREEVIAGQQRNLDDNKQKLAAEKKKQSSLENEATLLRQRYLKIKEDLDSSEKENIQKNEAIVKNSKTLMDEIPKAKANIKEAEDGLKATEHEMDHLVQTFRSGKTQLIKLINDRKNRLS